VAQHSIESPVTTSDASALTIPLEASLAYGTNHETNTEQSILSPVLNFPSSFGSAYVGQRFSCTLCANHDSLDGQDASPAGATTAKVIRNVRIEAEMKTPNSAQAIRLDAGADQASADLQARETLQKVVNFDLKEEGNYVLAVTVSYYEATETSGRTRTFRKLYQFICKASLVIRTKVHWFSAVHCDDTSAYGLLG
jgi:trafficking protein particle complex subunit 13